MAAKQVKTVSISKSAQEIKANTGTSKQVILDKGPTAPESKSHAAHKPLVSEEATVAQVEDEETELVYLLDKYVVEADFLDEIEGKFCEIYPSLLDDVDYSPAEIVGEMFWSNLTDVGQRLAILCLKQLATESEVPLVDVTCEACGITSFAVV